MLRLRRLSAVIPWDALRSLVASSDGASRALACAGGGVAGPQRALILIRIQVRARRLTRRLVCLRTRDVHLVRPRALIWHGHNANKKCGPASQPDTRTQSERYRFVYVCIRADMYVSGLCCAEFRIPCFVFVKVGNFLFRVSLFENRFGTALVIWFQSHNPRVIISQKFGNPEISHGNEILRPYSQT